MLFCRDQQFELKADYSADSPIPQGSDSAVGRFIVGPAKASATGDKPKLKVRVIRLPAYTVPSL